jgi:hypothetical protein
MKTDVIRVSSREDRMEEALKQAEKTAVYKELSQKNALHLRLLTEEMMSMMRAIAGDVEGSFWIEDEGGVFRLNLQVEADMSAKKREQLISASSSGRNEADKGIMGKIRAFFEPDEDYPVLFNMYYSDEIDDVNSAALAWSLDLYRDEIMQSVQENREGAKEAWDELEKSVVSRVADNVKVSIRGREILMVIEKKMA